MGDLTSDRPKCLLEIDGRTLLDRQVAALTAAGVTEIGVVTGWQAERFAGLPFRLFHNARWADSSMVDSLACAEEWLRTEPVVVSYGDIVYAPDAVRAVLAGQGSIVVAYDPNWLEQWSSRFEDPLSDAETFRLNADRTLAEIGGSAKSATEIHGQYMGLLKLDPEGWRVLAGTLDSAAAHERRTDTTALLAEIVATGAASIEAVAAPGLWHEFDSNKDLLSGHSVVRQLDALLSI
ncbi:phosphocholine cytidylyltransferase family protein [Amycolatopsis bartoniae]|nr:phosphocholine cytidylyltransferase family protein [Amycolatopsis bartoniae]